MEYVFRQPAVIAILLSMLGPAQAARADDEKFDFRGKKFDTERFHVEGPDANRYIEPEEEGLRIHFPPGEAPPGAVGVRWLGHVKGDFVATFHYDILKADPSPRGNGVELYLWLDNETRDGLPLSRFEFPQGPGWTVTRMTGERANRHTEGYVRLPAPPESKRGRLRVKRQGSVFIAYATAADDEEFQELSRYDIGTMDVLMVRFAGLTSGSPNAELDVRLLDAQLKSKGLEGAERATPASPAGARSALRVVVILGAATLCLVAAAMVLIWRRRKTEMMQEVPSEEVEPRDIRLACTACSKKIKIKPEFAGRRVKCPECGQAVAIPRAD